jgi:uncharacterized nucleotidyltransferase DUF6036
MKRADFEHLMAAAAEVADEDELIVIGSQAILGSHPDAPEDLLLSMEADVYPRAAPEKAERIDGALGDGSMFHAQYGYYAHGVGPTTARAPAGWIDRLVPVAIPPRPGANRATVALCMEVHDLVLAKLAAGRDRDWEFARLCVRHRLCDLELLLARCDDLPIETAHQAHVARLLAALA